MTIVNKFSTPSGTVAFVLETHGPGLRMIHRPAGSVVVSHEEYSTSLLAAFRTAGWRHLGETRSGPVPPGYVG